MENTHSPIARAAARWATRQAYRKMRSDGHRLTIEMPSAPVEALIAKFSDTEAIKQAVRSC